MRKTILFILLSLLMMRVVVNAEEKPLEVIGINNDYPYMYVDKDGHADGFVVDLLKRFASENDRMITFSFYPAAEALEMFKNRGDIFYYSDLKIKSNRYSETVPIEVKKFHIYYNGNVDKNLIKAQSFYENLKPLEQIKIGVRKGQEETNYVTKIADADYLKVYDDYSMLLADLDMGIIDIAILPYYQSHHLITLEGYRNIKWLDTPVFYEDVTLKTKSGEILDELSIQLLHDKKSGFISELHKKWLETDLVQEVSSKSILYFNVALSVLAFLLIGMVTWNSSLQKMVRERTKRLEEEIAKNKELYLSVIEKEKFKNDYFMNLSHELRTPINIILSAVQLNNSYIEAGNIDKVVENAGNYTEIIRNNSYRLLRVVNNLIDINKIETGSYPLNIDYVDIVHLAEKIVKSISPFVRAKGLKLEIKAEYEEIFVECDPFEIERVMLNLLSNAIKFSDRNGKLKIKIVKNTIHQEAVISVKDNGVGITKENQKKIFEKYIQVNNELTRSHEGNGLGLSLVKSIIEMHGGTISLFSELDEGSEFVVHLPLKSKYEGKIDKRKDFVYQLHSQDRRVNLELADLESLDAEKN